MPDTSMRACARQLEGRKMSTICLPGGMNSMIPWSYDVNWCSSRDHHANFSKSNPQNKHRAKTATIAYNYNKLGLQRVCAQLRTYNRAKHPSFIKNLSTNLSTKSRSGPRCHMPKKFSSYEITKIKQHEYQKVGGPKMKWFKHYSNASSSNKLTQLVYEMGVEGYGYYWLLLELLSEEFDGKSDTVKVHKSKILEKVQIKFSKKLAKVLQKLADFSLTSYQLSGDFYIFDASILLDLQSKDFKYSRLQRKSGDPKNKEERIKNKEERINPIVPLEKPAPCKAIFELWNSERQLLPKARSLSEKRKTAINARLKEHPEINDWREALRALAESDFCNGKNDRNWVADFDFFIKPDTITKALEGRYANRQKKSNNQELWEMIEGEEANEQSGI